MKLLLRLLTLFITTAFMLNLFAKPNPTLADNYYGPFKECQAGPINPAIGENVSLSVETSEAKKFTGQVVVKNGQTKTIPFKDNSATTIRTINLGSFTNPGVYSVDVRVAASASHEQAGIFDTACFLHAAFSVNTASNIKLEAPKSPITKKFETLPLLVISGLETGKTYHINLVNWKGDDLADHTRPNAENWVATGGKIIAENICNNGNTNRPEIGDTKCTASWGNQVYGINIKKGSEHDPSVAFLSFRVADTSGENPCFEGKTCSTALGDIPTDITEFAGRVLDIAIGIAGGIALILMVIGSIRVLTSSGDQQKLAGGRDMLIAAVAGLLFLIFSVLILKFIGVEVLKIPGFGS